jgi:hypothetical protein
MAEVPISFGRGSNKGRFGQIGQCSHVNAYVEDLGEAGKTPYSAVCINGMDTFTALAGSDGVDAMLPLDSLCLVLAGTSLSTINVGGVETFVGGIPSHGFTTMARNRLTPNPQVSIVRDGLVFIYEGGTVSQLDDPDLPPPVCYCGRKGCVEAYLSGPALARDHSLLTGQHLDPQEIVALNGASMVRYEERLARALAVVINILDPDVIVLGGGVSNIGRLYESVPRLWTPHVFSDRVATRLVRAKHGDSSGVRGAAWLWEVGPSG